MAGIIRVLSMILPLSLALFPSQSHSQTFRMEDGSTVTIENPQRVPLSQQDLEQIRQAASNLKNSPASSDRVARNEALDAQNYRRQLETELSIERSRRETIREYDRLEREMAKTQRVKEGRDVILYREGYGNTTYRGGYGNVHR
jgi:hypothetical protein